MGKILKSTKPTGDSELDFLITEIWEAIEHRLPIVNRPGILTVEHTEQGQVLTPVGSGPPGSSTTGMIHRGEWSSGTTYALQNVVSRGNLGEFVAFAAPPVGTPPESGGAYWHGLTWPSPGVWA